MVDFRHLLFQIDSISNNGGNDEDSTNRKEGSKAAFNTSEEASGSLWFSFTNSWRELCWSGEDRHEPVQYGPAGRGG